MWYIQMALTIALTYNPKRDPTPDQPRDFYAEFDAELTIDTIESALKSRGHRIFRTEANDEIPEKLIELHPDMVFNIAEGIRGESRESHVPAICEMLGIPYTGSGPLTLAICLNKARTNRSSGEKLRKGLKFPLIVKPLHEGSGMGIMKSSVVKKKRDLMKMVSFVINTYKQPALVEEFLPGREFTISILGNIDPLVLPIIEIKVDDFPEETKGVYGFEAKYVFDREDLSEVARLSERLRDAIREIALKTYRILECRDFCRVDIRLDKNGIPNVIDVNPLAGISPSTDPLSFSYFTKAAILEGMTYEDMINHIFDCALERCNGEISKDGT